MLTDQPDLLAWRGNATTSGPRPTAADGTPTKATSRERWDAFARANPTIAAWCLATARRIVAAGHKRVSAKAIVELARAEFATPINNSATAGLGEWLSEHDDLRPYVERRGKAAP